MSNGEGRAIARRRGGNAGLSAFWPLALFFVFSALAFGCMENWSIATCEVLLFGGAALVGWSKPGFWSIPKNLWLPALLVVVLAAVGLLQLVPLPAAVWKACGAERYTLYEEGAEAEALLHTDSYRRDPFAPGADQPLPAESWVKRTPETPGWIPASFTPGATFRALLGLGAALCLILLLEQLAEEGHDRLRQLGWLVGGLGLLVTFTALAQVQDTARSLILWVRPSPWAPFSFGPFVNTNHGEAFINLALPLLYYSLWHRSPGGRLANRLGMWLLLGALATFHVVVLLVSSSRAAFLPIALYPVVFAARFATRGGRVGRVALAAALLVLVVLAGVGIGTGFLLDPMRVSWNQNVPATHWIIGQGLASFEARFPAVLTDLPLFEAMRSSNLENEYHQVFFEAGLVPALLAVLAAGAALWLALGTALHGHSSLWLAPPLAAETLHAAVDFTGHVFPLVGTYLLLWMLCALAARRVAGDPVEASR